MTSHDILKLLPDLKILVIGDLMLDHYIWGDVHRISPEAPVPVVHAIRDTHTAGGAANVALNLSALGIKTTLIGTLGQDANGTTLLSLLAASGINAEHCLARETTSTIIKTRVIVRTQQLCRIDREETKSAYQIEINPHTQALLDTLIANADAVILSDYAKGLITQELLDQVSVLANKHAKLLAFDPKPKRQLICRGVGLITPNRHEALELAGLGEPGIGEDYPLAAVCQSIHEKYAPKLLVITLGADGMAVSQKGKIIQTLPTSAREVFDVSGAGDTVIASLTAALAAGASPLDATAFANQAAGIVVSKVGTAVAMPEEMLRT
jgi:rfaE bifunctional protein kinase chain/domain